MGGDDVFDIDIMDDTNRDSKMADNLKNSDMKLSELRTKLFKDLYENLLKYITNSNKYLKKTHCIYTIPLNFNGVVLYKDLRRCFMKNIIIKLYKENFKITLIDKDTVFIKW